MAGVVGWYGPYHLQVVKCEWVGLWCEVTFMCRWEKDLNCFHCNACFKQNHECLKSVGEILIKKCQLNNMEIQSLHEP